MVTWLPLAWGQEKLYEKMAVNWTDRSGIAKHLKCSLRHVGDMMRRRELPYSKAGKMVRFDIDECDRAMKALEIKTALLRN
jgi:hypothetical protein